MLISSNGQVLLKVVKTDIVPNVTFDVPAGITRIDEEAFDSCGPKLNNITLPQGLTSIGVRAFDNCWGLYSITIPQGVLSISKATFRNCIMLKNVTIPPGVTNIGDKAFQDCESLESITIPQGVTRIGYRAFSGCIQLTSITIPQSVTIIDDKALEGCHPLLIICPDQHYQRVKDLLPEHLQHRVICQSYSAVIEKELSKLRINNPLLSTLRGSRIIRDVIIELTEAHREDALTTDYYAIENKVRSLPKPTVNYTEAQCQAYQVEVRHLIARELKSRACIRILKQYASLAESQIPEQNRQWSFFESLRPENKLILNRLNAVKKVISRLEEGDELKLSKEETQLFQGTVLGLLKKHKMLATKSNEFSSDHQQNKLLP